MRNQFPAAMFSGVRRKYAFACRAPNPVQVFGVTRQSIDNIVPALRR
jgi:hypothetical protein